MATPFGAGLVSNFVRPELLVAAKVCWWRVGGCRSGCVGVMWVDGEHQKKWVGGVTAFWLVRVLNPLNVLIDLITENIFAGDIFGKVNNNFLIIRHKSFTYQLQKFSSFHCFVLLSFHFRISIYLSHLISILVNIYLSIYLSMSKYMYLS